MKMIKNHSTHTEYRVKSKNWILSWFLGVIIGIPLIWLISFSNITLLIDKIITFTFSLIIGEDIQSLLVSRALINYLLIMTPGFVAGFITSFVQWFVLQKITPIYHWLLISVVGSSIGWLITYSLFDPAYEMVLLFIRLTLLLELGAADVIISAVMAGGAAGYLGGIIIGSAQWSVLRRYSQYSIWWIFANIMGWSFIWFLRGVIFAYIEINSDIILF